MLVRPLLKDIPRVFVTLGNRGLLYADRDNGTATHYPTPTHPAAIKVLSVSGAGDWYNHNYYYY